MCLVQWRRATAEVFVGKAEVNVNVKFVQFSDGSSFGKSDWSEQLSSQRRSKIELMKSLSKAFDDGDAPALAKTVDDRLAQGGEPTFGNMSQTLRDRAAPRKKVLPLPSRKFISASRQWQNAQS